MRQKWARDLHQEVEVVLPSPWWPPLTYKFDRLLPEGIRVTVPLRKAKRVGFSCKDFETDKERLPSSRLREISSVIDEKPPLPEDVWRLLKWLGNRLPFGFGHAIRVACMTKSRHFLRMSGDYSNGSETDFLSASVMQSGWPA
jgi:primosomal protein N'